MSVIENLPIELKQVISTEIAWMYRVIPKETNGQLLHLWVDDQKDRASIADELEVVLGKSILLDPVGSAEIEYALNKYYLKNEAANATSSGPKILDANSDTFIENLIEEAKALDCSDIHLEPFENKSTVRMRLDGKLVERFTIDPAKYAAYVNKLKIMSHLDIAEKRLPQDGRIFFKSVDFKIDIRVSILPSLHGEKVVLRLLGSDASDIDIKSLGFDQQQIDNYKKAYLKPNGIILISGPTGSGKTTTLYATLKELNEPTRNILTIEDPIEYTLEGIIQVQLKEKIGLDFATALRTFLRQDPDIIMVGEIRDLETAKMATRAALTGHLVLSTIHTNSAVGIISRLEEMGISPYLVADTLNVAIAQRLVRLLCRHCKKEMPVTDQIPEHEMLKRLKIESFHEPVGCKHCYNTGFKGRKAIYEVIPIEHEISTFIKNRDMDGLYSLLEKRKIKSLRDSAVSLFRSGDTSFEEIYPFILNE